MICPFYFFEEITKKPSIRYRAVMARIALHIYYGEGDVGLDELIHLDQVTANSCMGAIAWVISQDKAGRCKISYKTANRTEIISKKSKDWLRVIARENIPDFSPF